MFCSHAVKMTLDTLQQAYNNTYLNLTMEGIYVEVMLETVQSTE